MLPLALHRRLARPHGRGSPTARPLRAGVCLRCPEQAPTPLQHPLGAGQAAWPTPHPSDGAAPLKAGICPHPAITWGSNIWPGRGSLRSLRGPRDHSSATARETNPSGVLLLSLPQADTIGWLQIVPRQFASKTRPAGPDQCPQWGRRWWHQSLPASAAALDLAEPSARSNAGGFVSSPGREAAGKVVPKERRL